MFSFCSRYSFSVSILSLYSCCKYLNCSKFFIRKFIAFSGDIGLATPICSSPTAVPLLVNALAKATTAPFRESETDSLQDLFERFPVNAGILGGFVTPKVDPRSNFGRKKWTGGSTFFCQKWTSLAKSGPGPILSRKKVDPVQFHCQNLSRSVFGRGKKWTRSSFTVKI